MTDPRATVTRQDRAISDPAWIVEFLKRAPSATIATARGEQPFQTTLLFVLREPQTIYFHHARRGRLWDNLQVNPQVCFTAFEMGRLLPADTALNFSMEYRSVVAFGPARLVEDPHEAEQALQLLLDKYFPHLRPDQDYRAITPGELAVTAVFRLKVEAWSGKQKAVGPDFPGAFLFPDA